MVLFLTKEVTLGLFTFHIKRVRQVCTDIRAQLVQLDNKTLKVKNRRKGAIHTLGHTHIQ